MALQDLLTVTQEEKKIGVSKERVEKIMPALRQYVAFWREYPDLFVDFMVHGAPKGKSEEAGEKKDKKDKKEFSFLFYQRIN